MMTTMNYIVLDAQINTFLLNDNDKGYCLEISKLYGINTDYDFFRFYPNYPCQEGINIGSKEQPKYSCTKCYQIFEFKKAYLDIAKFTKIINNNIDVEYCVY